MRVALAVFALGVALAHAAGPVCVANSGNGRLTIGYNGDGLLTECRWPGTTAPNQVSHGPERVSGAMWGAVSGENVDWMPPKEAHVDWLPGDAPIIRSTNDVLGTTEIAFIHPERDLAVFHIQFSNVAPDGGVAWFVDFSPCPKNMKGIPDSESVFPARRDLAAFTENGVVYHARPTDAGSKAWDEAETWFKGGPEPDWFRKGPGTWIGYSTVPQFTNAMCVAGNALRFVEAGSGAQPDKAVGDCESIIHLPLEPVARSATIFVAFADRRSEVDTILTAARQSGYESLLAETQQWWKDALAKTFRPAGANAEILDLYDRALRQLLLAVDQPSGAVARSSLSMPGTAMDITRDGVWATLALDLAGDTATAERHLRFYANAVRSVDALGAPAGSLPAALYGTGDEAVPAIVLDLQSSAWLLWAIWEHDARVKEQDREHYREEMWKSVELAGDFISSMCRAVRDAPVFSFDPARMSDMATLETVVAAQAGLRAANAFARAAGKNKPEWEARVLELEDYLRFHALDSQGNIKLETPLSLWATGLVSAGDPRWDAPVQSVLDAIRTAPGPNSLELLANLAMLLRDQREQRAALAPLVGSVVRHALAEYPCDSYYAALAVLTISIVFGDGAV